MWHIEIWIFARKLFSHETFYMKLYDWRTFEIYWITVSECVANCKNFFNNVSISSDIRPSSDIIIPFAVSIIPFYECRKKVFNLNFKLNISNYYIICEIDNRKSALTFVRSSVERRNHKSQFDVCSSLASDYQLFIIIIMNFPFIFRSARYVEVIVFQFINHDKENCLVLFHCVNGANDGLTRIVKLFC